MAKDVNISEVIQFVGVNVLKAAEQDTVQALSEEYFQKIRRQLNNIINLSVHVKVYDKAGERRKYSLHIKAVAPTHMFAADKADSWELTTAVHEAFQDIMNQITHRLHTDVTRPDRARI